ncbi:Bug family tripartite tricarboxylate transporter substrate binding protein [Ramlibacter alkalitolerans]|uniref:Tripartite tricarboxylate transporter substrate binding protein n=1 Tax=Ramlibacter alkalitolerans TaxID=2039631 RepID=A0ABS1JJL6_9BURK|nr:tripartite tricarboxylate transporter substrate binding protein [Ramlibacter alkalitolerans]MBL0424413.1 tripartite tricarboxylate transporter substrate binding protein [Ramlibacter alkalitolerans]
MKRKTLLKSAAALLAACAVPALAQQAPNAAAAFPAKPIRIVVGYAPGGANDILARLLAQKMQEGLGREVVVENKPSTGAIVGSVAVATAAPDGYTLLMGASGPIVFNPALYEKLPYSPTRDLVPVSLVGTFPLVLSVAANAPFKSVAELAAYTKANPEKSNYGSSAASFRLATELLKSRTGIHAEHIPYKGSMESVNGVASGQLTLTLVDSGPAVGPIKGGLLKGLAVTSPQRIAALPDVPTMAEQGIDLTIQFWSGLLAPAGTPKPIIDKLAAEVQRIVRLPDVRARMAALAIDPAGSTPEEFARVIANELPLWAGVAKANNIRAD